MKKIVKSIYNRQIKNNTNSLTEKKKKKKPSLIRV